MNGAPLRYWNLGANSQLLTRRALEPVGQGELAGGDEDDVDNVAIVGAAGAVVGTDVVGVGHA